MHRRVPQVEIEHINTDALVRLEQVRRTATPPLLTPTPHTTTTL